MNTLGESQQEKDERMKQSLLMESRDLKDGGKKEVHVHEDVSRWDAEDVRLWLFSNGFQSVQGMAYSIDVCYTLFIRLFSCRYVC